MSDNVVRGLAVVWCLSLYCIPLMILGAVIEWWLERKDRKAAERSERNKRRREREIQLAGYRLTNADERYRILHEPPRCERKAERVDCR